MSLGGNQRLKHFLIDYFLPQNCDPKYKYFIKAVAYYREQLRYEALAMEGSESFVKMPIRPDGIEGLDVIIKQNIQPIQPVQTFQPKSEPTPKTNKSVNLLDNDWNDWEYFLNSKKTSNNNPNNPNSNNNTNSTNFNNNASYLSNTNNSNIHNTIGNRNNNSVNSVSDNFTLQNKRTDVQQPVAKPKGFFEEIDGFFKKIDKEFTEVFKDAKINETFEDLSRMSTNYFGNFVENTKKVFCIVNEQYFNNDNDNENEYEYENDINSRFNNENTKEEEEAKEVIIEPVVMDRLKKKELQDYDKIIGIFNICKTQNQIEVFSDSQIGWLRVLD